MSNAHRHRFVSFLANVLLASLLLRPGRWKLLFHPLRGFRSHRL